MNPTEKRNENQYFLFDSTLHEGVTSADFDIEVYQKQAQVLGEATGRGTTYFVSFHELECVLRHYRRGGLMATLSRDKYWWSGLYRSRSFREWYLLAKLKDRDLPVPRAVAARVVRHGLWYTADLLMEKIPDSESLSSLLSRRDLDEAEWRKIGSVVRRFHQRGVYHADLNAHNILWTVSGEVFLVDFDRGELRTTQRSWQMANLNRLLRSLNKLAQPESGFHFQLTNWTHFMSGYTQL
jgi:3-deoxy-D-manno-octulosonic acid kinase